jgi:YaiO family outer membrane protein
MAVSLAAALLVSVLAQALAADRSRAEQLARTGHNAESLALFERIAAGNPDDTEARLWVARLQLRVGRTKEAEAGFRAVVKEHPADVDARIGLGMALTRAGEWQEALDVLRRAERDARDDNSDLHGALARAYRRAGDDRLALNHFERARALAPDDPDLVDGYEATAHVYGHSIEIEGFGEGGASDARSGSMTLGVRVHPRLRLDGSARVQRRAGSSDALGGAGSLWRVSRSTTLAARLLGGSGNVSLPNADLMTEVINYSGAFEVGGSFRGLSFSGAGVVALSPQWAWDPGGRWRFDSRYTYSRSSFETTNESTGDHSVLLRETWRGWRRVSVTAAYAYGIESFEDLTADRLQSLDASTVALGLRIRLPSLTFLSTAWEHQWRSNDTRMDRFTLSIVQSFP